MRSILIFAIMLTMINAANAISRDPFAPLATKWTGRRDVPPIQQYDLSQLTLVGVILETSQPRALFEDPTGRSHIATQKTLIGKKSGTITQINKYSVKIREDVKKQDGSIQSHYITMQLRR